MDCHHQTFHLNRIGPPATKPGVVNIMDFDKVTSLVGRNKGQVDFVLDSSNLIASQYISRLHGRIVRQENNSHRLFDDSLNGIFINNTKIMGSVVLQEGDIVTFGHPCGVRLKPGVWARQPDSEYQFIFERCSCPPSGKHISGKPAVLEDRINTRHSQTPVFKKPQAGAVKPSLPDKDNCDKISSMLHQDQTTKPSFISSTDQPNQSCYKLTDQSGQLHTNMTLPDMPDKHSKTSVNLSNSSSPRRADQSNNNKTGDASRRGHSDKMLTASTLLKDKTDIPDQVSDHQDNKALAEARQIIDKCMTTIAGMSATLTGSAGHSERCASMSNAALCSTSSCQVKENGQSEQYMSEINSNDKSSGNSTTSIVLSGTDVGEKQYSLNETMDVSSTNMLPNLSKDGNNYCEEHTIEADETNELPVSSETAELPAEADVKKPIPLLTDSSTLYTESPSASLTQLPSSSSSPLSKVSATSSIFPPSTLLSSVTSTEPLSSPATLCTSLTSNVPSTSSCASSFILGKDSSSLLSPSVQSVSSSTYLPSVKSILSPELTSSSKELLNSFHQELFDDQSDLPSASLTQPSGSSLKLRTSLNTSIAAKSPSCTAPSPNSQHISSQLIQSVPPITSSSGVTKVSSSPDLSPNSIEIFDSFPQELPVAVNGADSSVELSSLFSTTPLRSSTTQSISSPHYVNSASAPQLPSNSKEMEGGDNSLHVDQTDSSCSQSVQVAAQSLIHSRKNENVCSEEVVSKPPVSDDKGEKSAEIATPSTSSSVRNEIVDKKDTNSNMPSTSSAINSSITMECANFPIIHDNGIIKSTPKKGKNVSRKQKESPSMEASPSYIGCVTRGRKRKQKQLCPCCNHPPKNVKSSQNTIVDSPNTKSSSDTSSSRKKNKNSDNGLDASLLGTVQPDPDVVYLLSESHGVICISDDEEDVPLSKITKRGKNDSTSVESNAVCIELDENAPSSSKADAGDASQTGKETRAFLGGSQVNKHLEQVNCDILYEQNGNDGTNDVLRQEHITTVHHVNDKTPEVDMQFEDASPQGTKNDDKVSKEIENGESKRGPIMAVHEDMLLLQSDSALQSQKHNIEQKMEVGEERRDPPSRRNDDNRTSQVRVKDDDIKDKSDEIEMQQMKSECVTSKGEIDDATSLTLSGNRNYVFKEEEDIKPQEEDLVNTKLESGDIAQAKNYVTSGEEDNLTPKLESDGTSQIKTDASPKEEEDYIYDYYDDYAMPNVESEDDGDIIFPEEDDGDIIFPEEDDGDIIVPEEDDGDIIFPEEDNSAVHDVKGDPDDESVTILVKDEATYEEDHDGMSQSDDDVLSRQVEDGDDRMEDVDVQPSLEKNNGFKVLLQDNGYTTAQILANDVPAQIQNDDVTAQLQDDDVTAQIQDDDVTAQIQDDDVTAEIQNDDVTAEIQNDDVTAQIQDDDVTAQIQDDVTAQIQDDDVTAQIQDDDVTAEIQNDDVTAEIQNDDVTAEIQNDDDVTAQIQDDDVTAQKQDDDVTAEIQNDDVTAEIQNDDVTAEIQNDDVTAEIQDDDVTAQIQNDDVRAEIQNDDMTAQIQDDDVTAEIQNDDDVTAQIQDDDVTAQIQDDDVTAQIQDDDVTAQIQDDDVTAKIQNDDVTAEIQNDDMTAEIQNDDDDDVTDHIQEDDDYATAQLEYDDNQMEVEDDDVISEVQDDVTAQIQNDDVAAQLEYDDNQMQVKNDDVTAQIQVQDDDETAKIQNYDVTAQIQDDDDVTSQIQDDDVTVTAQIQDDVTSQIQGDDDVTAQIQNDDVTAEIPDDDVTAQIQDDDVTAQIQDDDDVTSQIQDDDVTAQIQDDDDVTSQIQDDDVTVTAQIQDDDVTAQIQNDDVTAEIQDDDVTAQIQDDDVTAQIQDDDVKFQIQDDDVTAQIQDDDVTSQIQDDDVTAKIQNDDVTAQIQNDGVTAQIQNDVTAQIQDDVPSQIQDDDVAVEMQDDGETAQIQDDDDVTAQIQDDGVTAQIQDDDVTAQIQNDDVTAQIQDDDDVTAQIQNDNDVTAQIQDDDVTAQIQNDDDTAQIQDDDDVTAQIQDDDVTAQIQDDDVTAQIQNDDVTAQIQNDDVTAQIQDDDDVTAQIQDDDVTAQLQDDDVTAQIQNDDVTAQIQNDDDVTAQIQDDDVTAQIQVDDVTAQLEYDDNQMEVKDDDVTAEVQDDVTAQIQNDDVTDQLEYDDNQMEIQNDDVTAQMQDDVTAQIQNDDDYATAQIEYDDDQMEDNDVRALIQNDDVTAQVQNDDVTAEIQNDDVTAEIQNDDMTAQIQNDDMTAEIQNDDDGVTAEKQNDDVAAEIQNDDVTAEIQNDEVTAEIQNDDMTAEIQNDDMTAEIQNDDDGVTVTAEIQNNDMTAEIQNDDVTAEIQNDDMTAEIQNDDVTAEIQNDDVTAEIQNDDVTAEIQNDDMTAEMQNDDVTAEIQNDDVTAEIQNDDMTAEIQDDDVTALIQFDDVTGHDGVTFPIDCDITAVAEENVDPRVKRNVAPYQRDNVTFQGKYDGAALELEDKTMEIGIDEHLPYDVPQTHSVFTSSKANNGEYANEGERSDPDLKGPANERVKDLENSTTMAKADENCFSNGTCSVDRKDTSFFTSTPNDCSLSKDFGIGLQEHPLSSVVDDSFSTVKDFSSTSEVQTDVEDAIRDEAFSNVEESSNLEFEKNSIMPKSNDVLENSENEMDELGSHDVELEREDKNKFDLSGRRHETSDNEVTFSGSQDVVDTASEIIGYENEIDHGGFRRREELDEVVTIPQGVSFDLEHVVDELKLSELNDVKLVTGNDKIEDAESTSQDLQSEESLDDFEKLKAHSPDLEKTEDVEQERSESSDVESEEECPTWIYSESQEFGYEDDEKIEIPEPHGSDFELKEDEVDVSETQEIKSDEAALKENCVFEVCAEEESTNEITISGNEKVDDELKISSGSNNLELGRDGDEHVFSTQNDGERLKEKNEPQKDLASHEIDLPVLKTTFENKEEGYDEVALENEIFDDEVSQSPCVEWGRGENKDLPQNLGSEKEDSESETCISELHKNILDDDKSEGLTSLPKMRLELENGLDMEGASKMELENKENMAPDVSESPQESGSEQRNGIEKSKPQECWPKSRDEIENTEEIKSNDQATRKGESEIMEKTENELLRSELQNESINEIEKFKENLKEEIEVEQEDNVPPVKRQRSDDDIDVEDRDCPAEKKNKFDVDSKDLLAGEIPAFPLAASFSDGEEDSDFELFPALHPSSTTTISRKRKTLDGILPSELIQYDIDGLSDLPKRNKLSTDTDDNVGFVSWTPIVPVSADLSSPVTLKQSDESSPILSQTRLAPICNDASSSMADNDKESSDCLLNDNDDRQARAMSPLIGNQSLLTDDIYSLTPGLISYSEQSKDAQCSNNFVNPAVGEGGPETELTPLATTRATDSPDNDGDSDRSQSNDEMECSKIDPCTFTASSVCSASTSGSGGTGSHYVSCISSPPKLLTLSSGAVEEEEDAPIPLERRREKREKLHAAVVLELQRINKDIKTFLSKDNPNLDQAVSVLEDLQDIPINSAVLAKFPSILETLNKCRKYKRSEDVRQASHEIYNRFKTLLL